MPDPFLMLASAFPGSGVPRADAEDSMAGAKMIPTEVTEARRNGSKVTFVQEGHDRQWYWILPDGKKVYHP